jgi:hypothetical protein
MAVIGGSVAGLLVLALLGFVVWPRLSGGDKVASVPPPTATTVQGVAESRQPASSLAVTPSKAAAPQATGVPTQAASPTVAPSASASEPIATQPSATPTPARSTPTPANSSPGAGEHSETGLDLPAPVSYLPRPGLQLELHEVFPSGEEADVELIAGKIADPVQVTVLRVTLEDGVVVNQFTEHFVAKQDGVYAFPDDDPSTPYRLLGSDLKKGAKWEKDGVVSTVLDTGVTVDLGFMKAENCLVVEYNNTVVEYKEMVYYAPGLGEVMSKSPSGEVLVELKAVKTLGEKQAADILRPLSPNVGQVKP